MSIKLKDTIYNLINNSDKLDGKHSSDFSLASHTHNYAGSSSAGGVATSAAKLATARTISLTGSVTGSGSFDGSGNLSIATTTNHTHQYAAIDHTHLYAGSSSVGGAATSALTISARTPQLAAANESNNIDIVENAASSITTNSPTNLAAIIKAIRFRWYDTYWQIGNIRGSSTNSVGFGVTYGNNNLCFRVTSGAAYVGAYTVLHTGNWSTYCASVSHNHNSTYAYVNGSNASGTWGINITGTSTYADYLSYHDFYFTSGTTVADWTKSTAATRYAGKWFSVNGWAWANSSNINVGGYSLDRMRYSAVSIRQGNLTGTWQQQAILFIPTYEDSSMIYLAQMTTSSTAGTVTTKVKRYSDYDTIYNSLVNGYASSAGNADTVDSHHFSTVSALPSSPNSSTVYFIV